MTKYYQIEFLKAFKTMWDVLTDDRYPTIYDEQLGVMFNDFVKKEGLPDGLNSDELIERLEHNAYHPNNTKAKFAWVDGEKCLLADDEQEVYHGGMWKTVHEDQEGIHYVRTCVGDNNFVAMYVTTPQQKEKYRLQELSGFYNIRLNWDEGVVMDEIRHQLNSADGNRRVELREFFDLYVAETKCSKTAQTKRREIFTDDYGTIGQGKGDDYKTFAFTQVGDDPSGWEQRASDIVAAYNGTFVKGLNPAAMESLVMALEKAKEDIYRLLDGTNTKLESEITGDIDFALLKAKF